MRVKLWKKKLIELNGTEGVYVSLMFFIIINQWLTVLVQLEKLSDKQCQPESQLKFIIEAWLQVILYLPLSC